MNTTLRSSYTALLLISLALTAGRLMAQDTLVVPNLAIAVARDFSPNGQGGYTGVLGNWDDAYSGGWTADSLEAGDMYFDGEVNVYRVTSATPVTAERVSVVLTPVGQTSSSAPSGRGQAWEPLPQGFIPVAPLGAIDKLSSFQLGKVMQHNVATAAMQNYSGVPGEDGTTIYSGYGPPDPGLGAVGDFYVDRAERNFYGPKSQVDGWLAYFAMGGTEGALTNIFTDATLSYLNDSLKVDTAFMATRRIVDSLAGTFVRTAPVPPLAGQLMTSSAAGDTVLTGVQLFAEDYTTGASRIRIPEFRTMAIQGSGNEAGAYLLFNPGTGNLLDLSFKMLYATGEHFRLSASQEMRFNTLGGHVPINFLINGSTSLFIGDANGGRRIGFNTATPAFAVDMNYTGAMRIPVGGNTTEPLGSPGVFRFNSDRGTYRGYTLANGYGDFILGTIVNNTIPYFNAGRLMGNAAHLSIDPLTGFVGLGISKAKYRLDVTGTTAIRIPGGPALQGFTVPEYGMIRYRRDSTYPALQFGIETSTARGKDVVNLGKSFNDAFTWKGRTYVGYRTETAPLLSELDYPAPYTGALTAKADRWYTNFGDLYFTALETERRNPSLFVDDRITQIEGVFVGDQNLGGRVFGFITEYQDSSTFHEMYTWRSKVRAGTNDKLGFPVLVYDGVQTDLPEFYTTADNFVGGANLDPKGNWWQYGLRLNHEEAVVEYTIRKMPKDSFFVYTTRPYTLPNPFPTVALVPITNRPLAIKNVTRYEPDRFIELPTGRRTFTDVFLADTLAVEPEGEYSIALYDPAGGTVQLDLSAVDIGHTFYLRIEGAGGANPTVLDIVGDTQFLTGTVAASTRTFTNPYHYLVARWDGLFLRVDEH